MPSRSSQGLTGNSGPVGSPVAGSDARRDSEPAEGVQRPASRTGSGTGRGGFGSRGACGSGPSCRRRAGRATPPAAPPPPGVTGGRPLPRAGAVPRCGGRVWHGNCLLPNRAGPPAPDPPPSSETKSAHARHPDPAEHPGRAPAQGRQERTEPAGRRREAVRRERRGSSVRRGLRRREPSRRRRLRRRPAGQAEGGRVIHRAKQEAYAKANEAKSAVRQKVAEYTKTGKKQGRRRGERLRQRDRQGGRGVGEERRPRRPAAPHRRREGAEVRGLPRRPRHLRPAEPSRRLRPPAPGTGAGRDVRAGAGAGPVLQEHPRAAPAADDAEPLRQHGGRVRRADPRRRGHPVRRPPLRRQLHASGRAVRPGRGSATPGRDPGGP